jgi:FtsH-binding integral membrane protein
MKPQPTSGPERHTTHAQRALAVLAGGLCLTAAVAIWALIAGSFDSTSARLVGSTLATAIATLSGLAGATALGRSNHRHLLGQATIAVSGIALALAGTLIWIPAAEDSQLTARAFGISLAAMTACAHASLMRSRLVPNDGDKVQVLTRIAVVSASGAALLMSCLLLFVSGEVASAIWRLFGVLVVIAVLTTLLTPIARRMTPARGPGGPEDTTPPSPTRHRDNSLHCRPAS